MTANYRDYTTLVATYSLADDYTQIQNITSNALKAVPPTSLMKLSVAPGSQKYFSASPAFQARTENYRIPAPSKTAVNLTTGGQNGGSCTTTSPAGNAYGAMMGTTSGAVTTGEMPALSQSEYASLNQSYKPGQ
jgi:hypothetical protein